MGILHAWEGTSQVEGCDPCCPQGAWSISSPGKPKTRSSGTESVGMAQLQGKEHLDVDRELSGGYSMREEEHR